MSASIPAVTVKVYVSPSGSEWYSITGEHWYASRQSAWAAFLGETAELLETAGSRA